jgi:hypothetical protein
MKKIIRLTESDLARIVKRVIKENTLLNEGVPNTAVLAAAGPITVEARSVCGGIDYIKMSVVIQNTGTEAYILKRPVLKLASQIGSAQVYSTNEFNVTIGGKPSWSNPEGQNQAMIPKGKKATLNFIIMTNVRPIEDQFNYEMGEMQKLPTTAKRQAASDAAKKKRTDAINAFQNLKSGTLVVNYNGSAPLEIPVNFGGFKIDKARACDAAIALPKGF